MLQILFHVGIARFVGCDVPLKESDRNCDPGTVYTYGEGQSIAVNISLDFYGGGDRKVNQTVNTIYLMNPNNEEIVHCNNGMNCVVLTNDRVTVTQLGMYNVQISIKNGSTNDAGPYKAVVEASHTAIVLLTSTISINITSTGK